MIYIAVSALFVLLIIFAIVVLGDTILNHTHKDNPIRKWWVRHICSDQDMEPND